MPAAELLCTPADMPDVWPGFGALTPSRQTSLIDRASQRVLDHCRRRFLNTSYDERYDGKNQPKLWLAQKPVISIASIQVNDTVLDNTSGVEWSFHPALGYVVRGQGHDEARLGYSWPSGTANIRVVYSAGYPDVPGPVVEAACWTVQWLSQQGKISSIYASESIGDYSYTLNKRLMSLALPDEIASLLAAYVQDDGPV